MEDILPEKNGPKTMEVEGHSKLIDSTTEHYAIELRRRIVEEHKKSGHRAFGISEDDFRTMEKHQHIWPTGVILAESNITLGITNIPAGEFEFKKI